MRSWVRWMPVVACLACVWGLRTLAQDAPVPAGPTGPPWRPIPELPNLLWFTEFDETPDVVKKLYEKGTIKKGKPNVENDSMMSPGSAWGNNKEVEFFIKINTTPARFPDKMNPNQIFIQFSIWTNEVGKVEVWVRSGVEVLDNLTVPKTETWCPLKIALGTLANKADRIKPDSLVSEIHLKFKPNRAGDKLPEVYFDKILVTLGPPERMAMMLQAWQAKMGKISKSLATDGFCYDDKTHTTLQKLTLQAGRRGPALVFLPTAGGNGDLAAQWNAAAATEKLRGVKFEVAQDPRKMPLVGLDEFRAFLPYLLKTDAQAAMFVVTKEDGNRLGKDVDSLRVLLDRVLSARCIPLLCLPAADDTDKNLAEFLKSAAKLCDDLGVPYADQGFAFKSVPAAYAGGKLTAEGEKALCGLLVASYKHVQDALNPKGR